MRWDNLVGEASLELGTKFVEVSVVSVMFAIADQDQNNAVKQTFSVVKASKDSCRILS